MLHFNHLLLLSFISLSLSVIPVFGQSCDPTTIEDNLYNPSMIGTCDFDGDGFQDLIFLDSLSQNLMWKENSADINFKAAQGLITGPEIRFMQKADLNNDAFDEIIVATSRDVYYVQYLAPNSIDVVLLLSAPGITTIKALAVGDFNNDGYDGFVIGYNSSSGISLTIDVVSNDNGTLSNQNILSGNFGNITDLAVGDISKNGFMDIATTGYNNFWFQNLKNLSFSSDKLIASARGHDGKIILMDYDNDNKTELVNLNDNGVLQSFDIDISGTGLFSPVSLITGLPSNTSIWELVTKNGTQTILIGSATELIGLENIGNAFTKKSYCSSIPDLNGGSLAVKKNGSSTLVFSRLTNGSIEQIPTATGIDEATVEVFQLYPNPTKGVLTLEFDELQPNVYTTILNVAGQIVDQQTHSDIKKIPFVLELPSGLYFLQVSTAKGNTILKIIKE